LRVLLDWILGVVALVLSSVIGKALGFGIEAETDKPLLLFVAVAALALVNATIGRIARMITLPLACLTFGIAWVALNGLLFWWVGSWGLGLKVDGFLSGVVGSLLMSLAGGALRMLFREDER
jgi:putative membrane protein